jgi:iron complex outermembrane receptor protein
MRYDAGRQGKNTIGSAGNSSAGERDATAFFVETLYNPAEMDELEVSFSARQDDYSDFVAGPVIQATGRPEFEDGLRTGVLLCIVTR